ncbi:MAG TPA: site-specific integrase [Solirubrobacterales bacterium]|nr:site-specific integrase [Solirubrobacterales bacterium]
MSAFAIDVGDELVEAIARRAAELIAERQGPREDDTWLRGADKIASSSSSSSTPAFGISEVVGLRWEHVDLGNRPRVLVREQFYKGNRSRLKSKRGRRDIPLSSGMARRLRTKETVAHGGAAPVFATIAGSELNRANVASRILKPAAKTAGVPWASFHSLRHTCASMLFEEGRNVKQVAEWLSHADPAFTLRTYVHLLDDGVGDADFFDRVSSSVSLSRQDDERMLPPSPQPAGEA